MSKTRQKNRPHTPGKAPPGMSAGGPKSGKGYNDSCRERFLFTMQALVGRPVEVAAADGGRYAGVLHTAAAFPGRPAQVVLKAAEALAPAPGGGGGGGNAAPVPGSTMIFPLAQVLSLRCRRLDLGRPDAAAAAAAGAAGAAFRTDTEISGRKQVRRRGMEEVDHSWLAAGAAGGGGGGDGGDDPWDAPSADSWRGSGGGGGGGGGGGPGRGPQPWDQFEANERLFNVRSTFDENLYTTALDRGALTAAQLAAAERLAREIEGKKATNLHLAEERGQAWERDYTEEERYGGVQASGGLAPPPPPPSRPWQRRRRLPPATGGACPWGQGPRRSTRTRPPWRPPPRTPTPRRKYSRGTQQQQCSKPKCRRTTRRLCCRLRRQLPLSSNNSSRPRSPGSSFCSSSSRPPPPPPGPWPPRAGPAAAAAPPPRPRAAAAAGRRRRDEEGGFCAARGGRWAPLGGVVVVVTAAMGRSVVRLSNGKKEGTS